MHKRASFFRILFLSSFSAFFIPLFSAQAIEYQKVSLGDTIRIGEFLFEDDYTPSTADCTLTIYDPSGTLKYTGTMTENANGWHYHDYTVGGGEALGNWPTSMACGTAGVDLVIADKTFTVIPTTATTNAAIATSIWSSPTRSLTTFGTLVADVASAVWSSGTRSLTTFGTLVADVWTNGTRTLTGATLDTGSLAVQSDITSATSTLTAEIQSGWTVTLSDFGDTTVNTAYKAKLQVLNHATTPTDADSLPTVVITDPVGTVQVPAGVMTKDSDGTYSYSYSIGGSAIGGAWETVVSVVINGETVKVNDYWSLSSSPADVQILAITDAIIPTVTASVRIDNMGTSASDFYYVYCIVSSADNLCGGNDDIDSASDTAYINAGGYITLSLTLDDVPTAGTYWFKVKARALAETLWAASTEQFTAQSSSTPTPTPPPSSGNAGGNGGGGGAPVVVAPIPPTPSETCSGADFNSDSKVNSVDFSILLAFWQKLPPFKNPCVDINKDNKVNSVDFSILLYQWKK